jgi:3-hydroxyacyl-[acyl-carrier-protein] dehydratase
MGTIEVSSKDLLFDISTLDPTKVVADLEEIRRYNPQRFEMEQLTAVVHVDPVRVLCIGYKDLTDKDFWVRGHMPGMPLMPGVVMLECVAQLCSYFVLKYDMLGCEIVGFGGLENVKFRDPVFPGSRFWVICEKTRLRRGAMVTCKFQGIVDNQVVLEGELKGVAIPKSAIMPKSTPASTSP